MSDASGDHMVETYSSMSLVMALYVASIVSFCFPHVVHVSALSTCIVLGLLLLFLYYVVVCGFGVESIVLVFLG